MSTRRVIGYAASVAMLAVLSTGAGCDKKTESPESEKPVEQSAQTEGESTGDEGDGDKGGRAEKSGESAGEQATETAEKTAEAKSRGDGVDPALLKPEEADEQAPETFNDAFETTAGEMVAEIHRDWAPKGADRLYNLVRIGFYDNVAFFRVIDGFMAQFGLKGSPKVDQAWKKATIEDDPVKKSNKRGYVTFAKRKEADSRTTQLFINFTNNSTLDKKGFAPVGKLVEGTDTLDEIYRGYGGNPSQGKIRKEGNTYLKEKFPKLDWIKSAEIVE